MLLAENPLEADGLVSSAKHTLEAAMLVEMSKDTLEAHGLVSDGCSQLEVDTLELASTTQQLGNTPIQTPDLLEIAVAWLLDFLEVAALVLTAQASSLLEAASKVQVLLAH